MDGFMKNLSSSTPIKSSDLQQRMCSSKETREIDENEQDLRHQMGSKSQNLKKSDSKHFMSPTISAASKVSAPRKKILSDRNESSGSGSVIYDTHFRKTSHIDSSPAPQDLGFETLNSNSSQFTPVSSRISGPDKGFSDLGSQPYDPLTNYLSPRPKFLRYNPNRRVEIFLRREKELRKWGDGLTDTDSDSLESQKLVEEGELGLSSSQERPIELEDGSSLSANELGSNPFQREEIDDSEDEYEDDEEAEKERHYWHLKEVLQYLLLLGVLLLSTMYISSMNSPTSPPSLCDLKEGYHKIQDHVFQMGMNNSVVGNMCFDQKQEKDQKFVGKTERIASKWFGKEEMETTAEISDSLQVSETQSVPDWVNYPDVVHEKPSILETKVNSDQDELAEEVLEVESAYDDERGKVFESKPDSYDEQARDDEKVTNEEVEKEEMVKNEVEKELDVTDDMVELIDPPRRENTEIFESLEVPQVQLEHKMIGNQNITSDTLIPSEPEVNSNKGDHPEPTKIESISTRMGISLLSVIAASAVLGFCYLKRRKPSAKDSSPVIEPSFESMVVEERSSGFHKKVESIEERMEKAEVSSVHSEGKDPKELYQSRAPMVELLGEYMVKDFNSSLKSCSLISKPVVGEESNFSVSQEKRPRRTQISPSSHERPSVTGFSSMDSSSYGRFTAQEKMIKQEENRYGEESMKLTTTPVRRSSRIRNRGSVMSP